MSEPCPLAEALQALGRAAEDGFAWRTLAEASSKVAEEADELQVAIADGDVNAAAEELGDLLFAAANVARWLGVDPAAALRRATAKFEARLRVTQALAQGAFADADLEEQLALWNRAKRVDGGR